MKKFLRSILFFLFLGNFCAAGFLPENVNTVFLDDWSIEDFRENDFFSKHVPILFNKSHDDCVYKIDGVELKWESISGDFEWADTINSKMEKSTEKTGSTTKMFSDEIFLKKGQDTNNQKNPEWPQTFLEIEWPWIGFKVSGNSRYYKFKSYAKFFVSGGCDKNDIQNEVVIVDRIGQPPECKNIAGEWEENNLKNKLENENSGCSGDSIFAPETFQKNENFFEWKCTFPDQKDAFSENFCRAEIDENFDKNYRIGAELKNISHDGKIIFSDEPITYEIKAINTGINPIEKISLHDEIENKFLHFPDETEAEILTDAENCEINFVKNNSPQNEKNKISYFFENCELAPENFLSLQFDVRTKTYEEIIAENPDLAALSRAQIFDEMNRSVELKKIKNFLTTSHQKNEVEYFSKTHDVENSFEPRGNLNFSISKSADPPAGNLVDVGEKIKYNIRLQNLGNTKISTKILDELDSQLKFFSNLLDEKILNSGQKVELFFENVTGENFKTFEVVVDNYDPEKNCGRVCNFATAENFPEKITEKICHQISDPDFKILKTADLPAGRISKNTEKINYTISIENLSDEKISEIKITDELDPLLKFAGGDFSVDPGNSQKIFLEIAEILPGEKIEKNFSAEILSENFSPIENDNGTIFGNFCNQIFGTAQKSDCEISAKSAEICHEIFKAKDDDEIDPHGGEEKFEVNVCLDKNIQNDSNFAAGDEFNKNFFAPNHIFEKAEKFGEKETEFDFFGGINYNECANNAPSEDWCKKKWAENFNFIFVPNSISSDDEINEFCGRNNWVQICFDETANSFEEINFSAGDIFSEDSVEISDNDFVGGGKNFLQCIIENDFNFNFCKTLWANFNNFKIIPDGTIFADDAARNEFCAGVPDEIFDCSGLENISIEKTVKNENISGSDFAEKTFVASGDKVKYKLHLEFNKKNLAPEIQNLKIKYYDYTIPGTSGGKWVRDGFLAKNSGWNIWGDHDAGGKILEKNYTNFSDDRIESLNLNGTISFDEEYSVDVDIATDNFANSDVLQNVAFAVIKYDDKKCPTNIGNLTDPEINQKFSDFLSELDTGETTGDFENFCTFSESTFGSIAEIEIKKPAIKSRGGSNISMIFSDSPQKIFSTDKTKTTGEISGSEIISDSGNASDKMEKIDDDEISEIKNIFSTDENQRDEFFEKLEKNLFETKTFFGKNFETHRGNSSNVFFATDPGEHEISGNLNVGDESKTFIFNENQNLKISENFEIIGNGFAAFILRNGDLKIEEDVEKISGIFIIEKGKISSVKNSDPPDIGAVSHNQLEIIGQLAGNAENLLQNRRYIGEIDGSNNLIFAPSIVQKTDTRMMEKTPPKLEPFLGENWEQSNFE